MLIHLVKCQLIYLMVTAAVLQHQLIKVWPAYFKYLSLYLSLAVMSGKRLKRHNTKVLEKTIELALVIDRSLYNIHQENLEDYILHIMNTVSQLVH